MTDEQRAIQRSSTHVPDFFIAGGQAQAGTAEFPGCLGCGFTDRRESAAVMTREQFEEWSINQP